MRQSAGITDFSSQRPAIDIIPGALTRHVTFRMPIDKNPRFELDDDERRRKWNDLCTIISEHVRQLRIRHHQCEPEPVRLIPPTSDVLEDPLSLTLERTAVIQITSDGETRFRMRVRVDVYTEICSVTYLVDRIDEGDPTFGSLLKDLRSVPDGVRGDRPGRIREALAALYDHIWSANSPIEGARTAEVFFRDESLRPGSPLTDFRGIVLKLSASPPDTPVMGGLDPVLAEFIRDNEDLIQVATGRHPEFDQTPNSGEPVCCGMLHGAALYAAELGRRSPNVMVEPVRHLLVFAAASDSQVGRLVRRLHVLGEFRHAALLDYDNADDVDLKRVSRTLRGLGREVDDIFKSGARERIEALPKLLAKLNAVQANAAESGILYRIEQSRYYAGEFMRTVPHLRSVRVRTWQTYDDFVARYIYQLFSRIDRVGIRYDHLMKRLSLLTTFSLAAEISTYQTSVTTALQELQTAAGGLRRAANNQVEVSEKQRSLLVEASLVAFVFLSYYVGSVFENLFSIRFDDGLSWKEIFYLVMASVTGALSAAALWLTVKRLRSERRPLALQILPEPPATPPPPV